MVCSVCVGSVLNGQEVVLTPTQLNRIVDQDFSVCPSKRSGVSVMIEYGTV